MLHRVGILIVAFSLLSALHAEDAASVQSTKRLDTLRYGIETQVIELLDTLKSEKNVEYAKDILIVFDASSSPKLKTAILQYLGTMELKDAEPKAVQIIRDRDNQIESLVQAAFAYLYTIKSPLALADAVTIVEEGEARYKAAAIKAIGVAGGATEAAALLKAYEADDVTQATKEAIVLALGAMKADDAFDLLSGIASSDESSKAIRMFACTALGDLGDDKAIPILIRATSANDPNVRAAAIAALSMYSTNESRLAIRESLKDAHVLPRIAAAKAVGTLSDTLAIPYLEYKASYDPEKTVREVSIKSLSIIGGDSVDAFLSEFYADTKNSLAYRSVAFGAVVEKGGKDARTKALEAFALSQEDKDRTVFTAFARALIVIDNYNVVPFARIMLSDKEFTIRLGGLAWTERNAAKDLKDIVKTISETDPNDAIKKRADKTLERLDP